MGRTKYRKVGVLNIQSGKIDITDPGYNDDVWCRLNGIAVKPGKYICYAALNKGKEVKEWGRRVASMSMVHVDAKMDRVIPMHNLGFVGVDAGLMSISEAGVKPNYSDETWSSIVGELSKLEEKRGVVAHVKKFGAGKKQFWSSTGFGDGSYDVFGVDTHDPDAERFVPDAITIDFIEDERLPDVIRLDKETDLLYDDPKEDLEASISDYLSSTYGNCPKRFEYVDNGCSVRVYDIKWRKEGE